MEETEYFDCPVCENRSPSCTICRYYRHRVLKRPYEIIAEHIAANYEKEQGK